MRKKEKEKSHELFDYHKNQKKDWETLFLETSNRGIVLLILKIVSRRARVIVLSKRPLINP